MRHILSENKQYVFKINDYFDVVYFNGFVVKSKTYDFSIGRVINSENHELIEILKSYNFRGFILIDLFAPNGYDAENRFFKFYFDGQRINKDGNIVHIPMNQERKNQDEYYRSHHFDLRTTVLGKYCVEYFNRLKYNS